MIRLYQRWISPYKGFRCAHRVVHGGASCSEFAVQAIQSHGAFGFWPEFRARLAACNAAAITYREMYFSAPTDGDVGGGESTGGKRSSNKKSSNCIDPCDPFLFMPIPNGCGFSRSTSTPQADVGTVAEGASAPDAGSCDAGGCDGGGCDVGGCGP